jgi:hypothetical protein
MAAYRDFVEGTRLVSTVEAMITTGDGSYDGTALEVSDENGAELFHVVVDSQGERQLLFFRSEGHFRMPVRLLEEILEEAKREVKLVPWPPQE